jgi:apolipoprotein D and lipocalin family protein
MFAVLLIFGGCNSNYPPLEVVKNVDINRYIGKWYEIARLPNSFEKGCYAATAEYSIIDGETIRVINTCNKDSLLGEIDQVKGKAFVVPNSNNAKLKVQFFWPFRGDYWIIDLDEENYQYALVGSPNRKYLWVLARTNKMDDNTYEMLLEKAKAKGFNIDKMEKTPQSPD